MKPSLFALLLWWGACGCADKPRTHAPGPADGAADAVADTVATGDRPSVADSAGDAAVPPVEAGPQCCTVTLSGPGNEDCPCAPYQTSDRSCHDVGRDCQYDGCRGVVSCHCELPEDGGAPLWSCQVLLH